jgi:hypothetical protein
MSQPAAPANQHPRFYTVWVIRVGLTADQPLRVYPRQWTSIDGAGWSVSRQKGDFAQRTASPRVLIIGLKTST